MLLVLDTKNKPVGSCKYSDITVFSFHPVKIITTGEGGAVLTNSKKLAERVRSLRSHGISREELSFINPSHGPWYYEQQSLGFNYRITDLQCALGLSQLARVESFVQKRNEIANKYHELLQNLPLILPKIQSERLSSFHLYTIQIDSLRTNKTRLEVFEFLKESGVGVQVHYIPIHCQPYCKKKFRFKLGDFPNAEEYYHKTITLPIYPGLAEKSQLEIIKLLRTIYLKIKSYFGPKMKDFYIDRFMIGKRQRPFIIAEMSGNHNKSLKALALVEAAAKAGAHAIKLQTYTADTMTLNIDHRHFRITDENNLWYGRHLYDLYQEAHTPWEWHPKIIRRAKGSSA